MIWFLAVLLWGVGVVMKSPYAQRFAMIAGLFVIAIVLHLVLPVGHPFLEMLGGDAAGLAILLVISGLAVAYGIGVRHLKRRAQPVSVPIPDGPFSEIELNRYARHIVLREIGGLGQKRLKDARVLVIGAGGLGSPALLYLAAAGVGTIGVVDDDLVDGSNLQRQVIHTDGHIDMPKVHSAAQAMTALNPFVTVIPYQRRLTDDIAAALFADYDIILDGSDNFETRYLANRVAVTQGKSLVSGALTQWEGQISVFDPAHGSPCYECVFPKAPAAGLAPPCAEAGVIGPLPGVIGAMMAVETVKLIAQAGAPLRGEMLLYDALYGETRKISLKPRADCSICAARQKANT